MSLENARGCTQRLPAEWQHATAHSKPYTLHPNSKELQTPTQSGILPVKRGLNQWNCKPSPYLTIRCPPPRRWLAPTHLFGLRKGVWAGQIFAFLNVKSVELQTVTLPHNPVSYSSNVACPSPPFGLRKGVGAGRDFAHLDKSPVSCPTRRQTFNLKSVELQILTLLDNPVPSSSNLACPNPPSRAEKGGLGRPVFRIFEQKKGKLPNPQANFQP